MNLQKEILVDGKIKKVRCDLPEFMKYTKEVKTTKNGKEIPYEEIKGKRNKIKNRINKNLVCPMNWLQEELNTIQMASNENTIPTEEFFVKMDGVGNNRQMAKIRLLVEEYDSYVKELLLSYEENEVAYENFIEKSHEIIEKLKSIKIGNIITINRLIETSLNIDKYNNNKHTRNHNDSKYTRKILNLLYRMNKDKFLINFIEN